MIPVRLTLKNFMSYGEEGVTLDFAGLHVVCLSGDNGNGKSALLDAITYALWGKTRASGSQSSAEDDLVRVGAEETDVTLEFRLGEELYRARRRRNRRTHSGDWQLYQQDPQGEWHPAGGSGSRETERRISALLRMDYETFLNSAYFQQGRADEFTRQKPDARKRILTEVLELGRYDRLEAMAKERREAANMLLKELDGEMRHLEARVGEEPTWREQLEAHEAELDAASRQRDQCETRTRNLRDRVAVLEERAGLVLRLQQHIDELDRESVELGRQIASIETLVNQDRSLIAGREQIEQAYDALVRAREELEMLSEAAERSHGLERERQRLGAEAALRRQELSAAIAAATQEARRLEEWEQERRTSDSSLAEILPQIAHFEAAQVEQDAARTELVRIEERFTELRAQNKRLAGDIDEYETVLELLDRPKPACPVCSTDLSGGKQAAVVGRQKQRLSATRAMLEDVKRDGQEVKKERESLKQRVEALEAKARAGSALRSRMMEITRRRDEAEIRVEEIGDARGRLACLREQLAKEAYAERERAELAVVEREIAGLRDALARRQDAERTTRELTSAGAETKLARLREAERTIVERETERTRLKTQQDRKREQVTKERAQLATQEEDLRAFDATRAELVDAEASYRLAAAAHDAARGNVDRARHVLEDIGRAAEILASRKKERDKVAKDGQAYSDLVAAFGKKGVQAVIIESMLPEIEEEANRLLSRLTDNQMQVTLTTQRQARSGSHQIETLDIQITDDAGTRPYELYSGGEAFRVNFALRIALSRLLARRSGARLQTLIIDEGFGSQDAKGRERLVEAIETVKDEFALILVISHIEEMKDAFAQRIEVTKTPEGSQLAFV